MSAHDLTADKWRSDDVLIKADDSLTFEQLHLKPLVLSALQQCGFVRPSPIQLQAIPLGRCGVDLIAQSKSGTGKTCVFVVIALEMIFLEVPSPQVLIVAPTREIADQICQVFVKLSVAMPKLKCCSVIGGIKVQEDVQNLPQSQVVVGTPGRINQLIELGVLKTSAIRLLVFDEADKLLDQNFKKQIDTIYNSLSENKQMIATSATMSNELANFLAQYMRSPAFVRLDAENPALLGVTQYVRVSQPHHESVVNFDNKIGPLIDILEKISFSQCIIFSNYQTRARKLCDKLNALKWSSVYMSSELSQQERLKAMAKLKKFKCRVLVSTDLTSRGIDIENVNLIINMDIPDDIETYLHRVGRAGRFGSHGLAITIASRGREFDGLMKILNEYKLSIVELLDPIPADIWTRPGHNDFDNDTDSNAQTCQSSIKSHTTKALRKPILSADNQLNFCSFAETIKFFENFSNDCITDKLQKFVFTTNREDLSLEFSPQDLKENVIDEIEIKEEPKSDQNSMNESTETSQNCNAVSYNDNHDHQFESQISLANAFFPPISNNMQDLKEWTNNNINTWMYLMDPLKLDLPK